MAVPIHAPHPAPDPFVPGRHHPRPHLRLVEGGPGAARRRRQPPAVYRRRRIGAALVVVTVIVGLLSGAASLERRLTEPPAPPAAVPAVEGEVYVVQPGDSVWSIAERLDEAGDIRATVDRLAEAAGGAELQPGQRIPLDDVVG